MMRTYKSSSFNAPIETAQLDEVQVERLDLGKHAVEGGPIQNTCQQRVFTLQLRHHRLKGRKGGRAKVARDPNRVQTRSLVHLSNGQDSRGESASPGSGEGEGYGRTSTEAPRCQTPWLLSSADHLPSDSAVRAQRSDSMESGLGRRVAVGW